MLSNYILAVVCDSNRLPFGHYDRKEGYVILSARAADRAADEAGVVEADASHIENSADAPRPFVQGRRPFYKTEWSTLPTKERQRTNKSRHLFIKKHGSVKC